MAYRSASKEEGRRHLFAGGGAVYDSLNLTALRIHPSQKSVFDLKGEKAPFAPAVRLWSPRRIMMKAAIVTGPNQTPIYGDFEEPQVHPGMNLITVSASAMSHLAQVRAAGLPYSSPGTFPAVAGIDEGGRTQDGQRVYFFMPPAPFGAMAEKVVVSPTHCMVLPNNRTDVMAAALANPDMSSGAALKFRAAFRRAETVLINGATGTAGKPAVQLAKVHGSA
ncbi:MAG: hypothetical protein OWS74_00505 [Firmicutes bacterium]|nr:hypothetical protein [Bacillota bacterium]